MLAQTKAIDAWQITDPVSAAAQYYAEVRRATWEMARLAHAVPVGARSELARRIGRSPQAVAQWCAAWELREAIASAFSDSDCVGLTEVLSVSHYAVMSGLMKRYGLTLEEAARELAACIELDGVRSAREMAQEVAAHYAEQAPVDWRAHYVPRVARLVRVLLSFAGELPPRVKMAAEAFLEALEDDEHER